MNKFGFVTIATVVPKVDVANPKANVDTILSYLKEKGHVGDYLKPKFDIILFPELSITGYTCGDLFAQKSLLQEAERQVARLARETFGFVVVGAPVVHDNCLYNAAIVINNGRIFGIVPKQNLPNYREFYEARWFKPGRGNEHPTINYAGQSDIPFGIDLIFNAGEVKIAVEICEDLWMPIPPSSYQATGGANIILNPSASNELVAKNDYRRDLVVQQSGRCIAAYAYASCGPSESTSDVVMGGHCLIGENGSLVAESKRVGDGSEISFETYDLIAQVDVDKLQHDRRVATSFFNADSARKFRFIPCELLAKKVEPEPLLKRLNGHPFIPRDKATLDKRCEEILGIAQAGLMKRMTRIHHSKFVFGKSGGLDSTLAGIILRRAAKQLNCMDRVFPITMRGWGSTGKTINNAQRFIKAGGFEQTKEIDIRQATLQEFADLGHKPFGIDCTGMSVEEFEQALRNVPKEDRHDLTFENVQARQRTFYLMNSGFVIGTGDMSEGALGWSTYNGDHMSMYNPNCSIPKTLVKFLIEHVANKETGEFRSVLLDIAGTKISPELLPPAADGEIEQVTEDSVGPYELQDFFLFHFIRNGFSKEKIVYLAENADFDRLYNRDEIKKWLNLFCERFFRNQFKRNCVPDGPKVGSVSLSPRGDWRMPSEADPDAWIVQ